MTLKQKHARDLELYKKYLGGKSEPELEIEYQLSARQVNRIIVKTRKLLEGGEQHDA